MEIPRTSYSRSCCFCFTLFPRFLCHTLSENAAGKRITNCNLSLQHYPSATTRNSRRALTGLKRWGCAQREDAHNIQVGSTLFNRLQVLVSSEWTKGSPSISPLSIRRVSPLSFSLSPHPFVIPSLMLAEKCVYASRPEVDSEDSSSGFNALQNWRQKLCTKLCVHAWCCLNRVVSSAYNWPAWFTNTEFPLCQGNTKVNRLL